MEGTSIGGLLPAILPELSEVLSSASGADAAVNYYKTFQSKLMELMKTLADENQEEIEVEDGLKLKKDGTAFQVWLQDFLTRNEFVISSLLESQKYMQKIENMVNSAAA